MKIVHGLIVLICVSSATPSSAIADSYAVFGDGTSSCGEYIQAVEREQRNPQSPAYINDRYYIGFSSFANGYLSSANLMSGFLGLKGDIGHNTDVGGRMVWLENWCRQHPLSMFADALSELVVFLRYQKR